MLDVLTAENQQLRSNGDLQKEPRNKEFGKKFQFKYIEIVAY